MNRTKKSNVHFENVESWECALPPIHMSYPNLVRTALLFCFLTSSGIAHAQETSSDVAELIRLHAKLIDAHLQGDVDSWMAIEADSLISANRGRITYPSKAERRSRRTTYLQNATFERYRDVRDPVVRISDDGSQGWLIAEVEVVGTYRDADGTSERMAEVWAWVELYERTQEGWKLVGNVSNSRPLH